MWNIFNLTSANGRGKFQLQTMRIIFISVVVFVVIYFSLFENVLCFYEHFTTEIIETMELIRDLMIHLSIKLLEWINC